MNKFSLYHFENTTFNKGKWEEINDPVFPLSLGGYLDERLDEAYITFFSDVDNYKTTDVFKVVVTDNSKDYALYYICGNDEAIETPVGSGQYKHKVFLLEPTKLTEGILCPSLTFTNDLGDSYTENNKPVTIQRPDDFEYENLFNDFAIYVNTHPIQNYVVPPKFKLVNSIQMSENYKEWVEERFDDRVIESGAFMGTVAVYSTLKVSYYYAGSDIEENETGTIKNNKYVPYPIAIPSDFRGLVKAEYHLKWHSLKSDYEVEFFYYFLVVDNKYPLLPYTITSMTQRVLELAEPLTAGKTPRFSFDGIVYGIKGAFSGWEIDNEQGGQAKIYNQIRADEITVTQATLREQLRTVAGLVHCEPRIKISESETEDSETEDNVVLSFTVYFEPYDKSDNATSLEEKKYSFKSLSCSINEYCTEVRSNARNLVNALGYGKGVLVDPGKGDGANICGYSALRPNVINERLSASNGRAETALPIYKIIKVLCGVRGYSGTSTVEQGYYIAPTDITPYVVEKSAYDLQSAYAESAERAKNYSIYYTQGEKGLDGLYYRAATTSLLRPYSVEAISNILSEATGSSLSEISGIIDVTAPFGLCFQITYVPIYPALLAHGKQKYSPSDFPFSQVYNQSENLIEAHYYGENIKGASARLGNVEQERTYILDSFKDIPEAGQTIDGYTIAATNVEVLPLYTKCTVALSKDFNRINPYVGISSNKRVYEVSEREAYERSILYRNYVVISKKELESTPAPFANSTEYFIECLQANAIKSNPVTAVYSRTFNKNNFSPIAKTVLPVVSSAFGNAILFTWYYKDNYSAGAQLEYARLETGQDNLGDTTYERGYWSKDVPYSDYYGRAFEYDFELRRELYTVQDTMFVFPLDGTVEAVKTDVGISGATLLRKDSREKLSFNLEFEFKTTEEDIIIGSGAASCCWLVDSTPRNAKLNLFNDTFGKLQQTTIGMNVQNTIADGESLDLTVTTSDDGVTTIEFPTLEDTKYTAWAISFPVEEDTKTYTDENGETKAFDQPTGGEIFMAGNGKVPDKLYIALRGA